MSGGREQWSRGQSMRRFAEWVGAQIRDKKLKIRHS
jgi:hypothetical protein